MINEVKQALSQTTDVDSIWPQLKKVDKPVAVVKFANEEHKVIAEVWLKNGAEIVAASSKISGRPITGATAMLQVLNLKHVQCQLVVSSGTPADDSISIRLDDLIGNKSAVIETLKADLLKTDSLGVGSTHANLVALKRWRQSAAVQDQSNQTQASALPSVELKAFNAAQIAHEQRFVRHRLFISLTSTLITITILLYTCVGLLKFKINEQAGRLTVRQVNIAINAGIKDKFGIAVPNLKSRRKTTSVFPLFQSTTSGSTTKTK